MTENMSDPQAVEAEEKRIADIKNLLFQLEKNLVKLIKAFKADGVVTRDEKNALAGYKNYMTQIKDDLLTAEYRLTFLKDPVMDPQNPLKSPKLGTQYYFNDSVLKSAFKGSIKNWTQDQAIGLNSVRTYMIEQTEPAGLSVMDAVAVVLIIFPPGKAIAGFVTAAVTLAPIIEKAFNTSLSSSGKPSLNDIHVAWSSALAALAKNETAMDEAYDHFVKEWKKKNGVDSSADWVWSNTFLPDCRTFANSYMPSGSVVQKAFLTKVISVVEDSNDWDLGLADGMADSGTAEIFFNDYGDKITFKTGQLDDVPSGLVKAIKTVYKGGNITDLPVSILLTVLTHTVDDFMIGGGNRVTTTKTSIVRVSNKAGNRTIKHKSGDKSVFKRFKAQGCLDSFKISQLSVDT